MIISCNNGIMHLNSSEFCSRLFRGNWFMQIISALILKASWSRDNFNVTVICISISHRTTPAYNAMLRHSKGEKMKKVIFRSTEYFRKQHFINIIPKKRVITVPAPLKTNLKPKISPRTFMRVYVHRETQTCAPQGFPRSVNEGLGWLLPTSPQKEPPLRQRSQSHRAACYSCKD